MCAPEFPPYHHLLKYTPHDAIISHDWVKNFFGAGKVMELNEQAEEKTKMRRRRKRVKKESDGEVKETYLKRKPSAPVKPPVSKKKKFHIDLKDVDHVFVLDSSSQPTKEEKKEEEKRQEEEKQRELILATEKLEKELKENAQLAEEEEFQKLLKDLDGMEEWHYVCPIHYCAANTFGKAGDEYYRCASEKCVLFCSKEEAPLYFDTLHRQLHEDYRYENRLPCCFCHQFPALKVSKSDKNHGRLYMNCAQPKRCDFFQWADSPLTLKNKRWMGWAPDVKVLSDRDPDVDGEGTMYTCPIHRTPLEVHVANNGWEYCKCSSGRPCMMFCSKKEARHYLQAVHDQLFVAYKCKDQLPVCFCQSVPTLKISHSDKNCGRPYMSCSQKEKCDFFQWADVPLFDKNRECMQGAFWEWKRGEEEEEPEPKRRRTELKQPSHRDRPLMVEEGIIQGPDDCPFRGLRYSADMEEAWGRLRRLYERSSLVV